MCEPNILSPIQSGVTWGDITIVFLDKDLLVPMDITGASIVVKFYMKNSSNAFVFKTSDGTIIITDPTNGVFVLKGRTITANEGDYEFDTFVTIGPKTYGVASGSRKILKHQPKLCQQ